MRGQQIGHWTNHQIGTILFLGVLRKLSMNRKRKENKKSEELRNTDQPPERQARIGAPVGLGSVEPPVGAVEGLTPGPGGCQARAVSQREPAVAEPKEFHPLGQTSAAIPSAPKMLTFAAMFKDDDVMVFDPGNPQGSAQYDQYYVVDCN
ncbi:hypothetical protein PG984_005535 [Apiospora sp. TS-2023a]